MCPPPSPSSIESGQSLDRSLSLQADVVVVGSGAGGAMVAKVLSEQGLSVVVLEEGGHHPPSSFTQREGDMLPRLFFDAGGRATVDGAVSILHGRGVGGSTVHNTNLCKRAPAEVLAHWVSEYGAHGWSAAALDADYAAVEALLSVTPLGEADVNEHNALFRRGMQRLGWRGGLLLHNRRGCQRSGFCELGCVFNAKENAQKVLIPAALAAGARVFSDVRVIDLVRSGPRVSRVHAQAIRSDGSTGHEVFVQARAVCIAGSAIGSAALVHRSGLPDPHGIAGKTLRLHPAVAVAGRFSHRVEAWRGIPQSIECTEKLSFAPGALDRTWLIPAFAHPGGFAGLLPGFGAAHAATMRTYPHIAAIAAMLHDETCGTVTSDRHGRPSIRYALSAPDQAALTRGIEAAAEILFAAGALEVTVPLATPLTARTMSDLLPLRSHRFRPLDPLLSSVHPMGSLPLGSDPRRSVVDPGGRHHQIHNVYVADGSVFPTSIGGPPQLTIYAAGRRIAATIAADLRTRA